MWDRVAGALQVTARVRADPYQLGIRRLAGLALRDNPRRAHLVVSTVLGKHLPVAPDVVRAAGALLAEQVVVTLTHGCRVAVGTSPVTAAAVLEDPSAARALLETPTVRAVTAGLAGRRRPLVVGFAETATALGHTVADALGQATYLHSTRRRTGVPDLLGFAEEHSHAVAHAVAPSDPAYVDEADLVVLVDDELTTGRTALNVVAALEQRRPGRRYVLAALLDLRTAEDRVAFEARAAALGVEVAVACLVSGELHLPADVAARAAAERAALAALGARGPLGWPPRRGDVLPARPHGARVVRHDVSWPAYLPTGGRHGFTGAHAAVLPEVLATVAEPLAAARTGDRCLVLGTEELMYAPLRLAALLGPGVAYQSTTRSPVVVADVAGYAVRHGITFPAPDDPGRPAFVYNVEPGRYDDIVVVVDEPAATPALSAASGLLDRLAGVVRGTSGTVHVVTLAASVTLAAAVAVRPPARAVPPASAAADVTPVIAR